ncbi:hypothetical protein DPMN_138898 [Dreissena polymorpha]|uniref:Uncharacterized protein n=1 Tax=Dreissena polymorpha TaxID=45954 RepID=A0A9D4G4R4_DREPO|nr:hypothetical protein DPMN_138898 [Dreissena polymorpha]
MACTLHTYQEARQTKAGSGWTRHQARFSLQGYAPRHAKGRSQSRLHTKQEPRLTTAGLGWKCHPARLTVQDWAPGHAKRRLPSWSSDEKLDGQCERVDHG